MSHLPYLSGPGRLLSTRAQVDERNRVREAAEAQQITNPLMLASWQRWQNDAAFVAAHDAAGPLEAM